MSKPTSVQAISRRRAMTMSAAMMLAPGAYHAQDVDDLGAGFKLASDEEVWVYRIADQRLADGVDWAEGNAATGTSFRRIPDATGTFATGGQTRGASND